MKPDPLGTVVCTDDGPSTEKIAFVIGKRNNTSPEHQVPVHVGQYVSIETEEGLVIAHVEQIYKTNRYFSQVDAVHEFTRSGKAFGAIFPIDRWEYVLAEAKPLGIFDAKNVKRVTYPPSPGAIVSVPESKILAAFLGFTKDGIHLGQLLFHDIPARFDLTKIYQKHVALLAMSGAGKSYAAAVMLEELLSRNPDQGRPAILVIDVHGEYISLAEARNETTRSFEELITVIQSPLVEIATPRMSAKAFATYSPDMGAIQVRELTRVIRTMQTVRKGQPYDLGDLVTALEQDPSVNVRTREALLGWLNNLQSLQLFGKTPTPEWEKLMTPGRAVILDLSETVSLQKKQIIVDAVIRNLFDLRRDGKIPPTIVFLEEAHQFCPEARRALAFSKGILETVAREGRKYNLSLCIISQRPVRLSTTVLSQCGSNIFLRITNPYDLDHIRATSEKITRSTLTSISSLSVGEALVVGQATRFPVFIHVRQRLTKEATFGEDFETVAKKFEDKKKAGRQRK
ncbi:MAG: ATP-binding protein [Candidatus Thorarchaeota archaeon]